MTKRKLPNYEMLCGVDVDPSLRKEPDADSFLFPLYFVFLVSVIIGLDYLSQWLIAYFPYMLE